MTGRCASTNACYKYFCKSSAVAEIGHRWGTIDMGQKRGWLLCIFLGGAGSSCNTMWPGPRPTSIPSGIVIYPAVWSKQTWTQNWGCAPLGGAGSPSDNVAWAEVYIPTKWHLDPFNRLVTIHWPKSGGLLCPLSPFFGGELGIHLTQCGRVRGLPACQVFLLEASNPLATIHQRYRQTGQTRPVSRRISRQPPAEKKSAKPPVVPPSYLDLAVTTMT